MNKYWQYFYLLADLELLINTLLTPQEFVPLKHAKQKGLKVKRRLWLAWNSIVAQTADLQKKAAIRAVKGRPETQQLAQQREQSGFLLEN